MIRNKYMTSHFEPKGYIEWDAFRNATLNDGYSLWLQVACNFPFSLDRVNEGVNTRLRAESAPLPEYLFSRSVAGATHVDIIRGLELASEGSLYGRFFCMYPDRAVPLTRWLAYWMKKGKFALGGNKFWTSVALILQSVVIKFVITFNFGCGYCHVGGWWNIACMGS